VINMTRDLAVELAPRNVRVNSISPGLIQSNADLLQGVKQALKPPYKNEFEARFAPLARDARVQNQPLAAVGAPADIAMACIYLASPAARFVTGADLLVDGGWIHMFHAKLGGSRTAWRAMVRFLRRLPPDAWLVGRPAWLNA
jgi:NAD(P)-dependent dehydrogenase (short-subunit alcohol dehydrogenase family)